MLEELKLKTTGIAFKDLPLPEGFDRSAAEQEIGLFIDNHINVLSESKKPITLDIDINRETVSKRAIEEIVPIPVNLKLVRKNGIVVISRQVREGIAVSQSSDKVTVRLDGDIKAHLISVTSSPVAAFMTSGPVMYICPMPFTIKMKSVRAGEYTAPPAAGPMITEI